MNRPRYEDYAQILKSAARYAAFKYGMPYGDCLCEANYQFVLARRAYRRHQGPFDRMLKFRLRRLADAPKQKAKRNLLLNKVEVDFEELLLIPEVNNKIEELSDKHLSVLRLAASSDMTMRPSAIRRSIIQYLRNLKWTATEIGECFAEIRAAL